MISIKNFSKAYTKNNYVVKNLNVELAEGDICAFVGHNGAGKTTTLNVLLEF